jgi:hypothetical protein
VNKDVVSESFEDVEQQRRAFPIKAWHHAVVGVCPLWRYRFARTINAWSVVSPTLRMILYISPVQHSVIVYIWLNDYKAGLLSNEVM